MKKEIESVLKDLEILVNPTDEQLENLPEISGFEAEIILKYIKQLNEEIEELRLELSGYKLAILKRSE